MLLVPFGNPSKHQRVANPSNLGKIPCPFQRPAAWLKHMIKFSQIRFGSTRIPDWILPFLHPGRLTWNTIVEVWNMIFLCKWVNFGFHTYFAGCNKKHILHSSCISISTVDRTKYCSVFKRGLTIVTGLPDFVHQQQSTASFFNRGFFERKM